MNHSNDIVLRRNKSPSSSEMALSLHLSQSALLKPQPPSPKPKPTVAPIRCGPRDNRGPLVKGRVLSIEAIQAVQALKRRSDPDSESRTLSRLLKADLLAVLRELLRQDRCDVALRVLSAVRSEHPPDVALYADVVVSLARNGMAEDIDRLISDLDSGRVGWDDKGTKRLVRAVIAAGSRDSTVRIYRMLKESGSKGDEYLVGALSKGLRKVGEPDLADEVVSLFGSSPKGTIDTPRV